MASSVAWIVFALTMVPTLVLIHELGHAFAVVLLTGRPARVTVGEGQRYAGLGFGRVKVKLFARGETGFCELPPSASPSDTFLISLAGPAASLLSAAALIGAFFVFAESSLAMVNLGLATLAALVIGIGNLIPNEDGQTDGWLAREAWRRWHGTPDWRKPLAVVEEREAEESFTRGVLTAAHGEAAAAGSSYMGTDHLLAALAGLDDHVGAALRAAGLRAQTDEASESAMRAVGALSPSLKRSLERAGKQAAERGAPEVVPEDLLLALLVEREGRAYELLQERGMSASDLHREMLEEKVR